MWMSTTCRKVVLALVMFQALIGVIVYYAKSGYGDMYAYTEGPDSQPSTPIMQVGARNGTPTYSNSILKPAESLNTETHFVDELRKHESSKYMATVAIGLGITTRKQYRLNIDNVQTMPFFRTLLKSFCKTASEGYDYNFFAGYDYNDKLLSKVDFLKRMTATFRDYVTANCPAKSSYSIYFLSCSHSGNPAWAQNDAMLEAYMIGMEYFYRINDDTVMKTPKWTERFISTLKQFDPTLVGVVGPKHRGGNTAILTYDFTHRTHINIHGFYYPREFPGWYGDRWITDVYKPGRSIKLPDILLEHTMESGQRYHNDPKKGRIVKDVINQGQQTILRYIEAITNGVEPKKANVISMLYTSTDADTSWGVVRNAQLAPVAFPGWTLRIYTNHSMDKVNHSFTDGHYKLRNEAFFPGEVLRVAEELNAQVVHLREEAMAGIPSGMAHYLVADDPTVEVFLIRNANERLSARDHSAVEHWLKSSRTEVVHATRDHPSHANHSLIDGLWGAKSKQFKASLGVASIRDFLNRGEIKPSNISVISSSFPDNIVFYDSVSCDSPHSVPYPVQRVHIEFVGRKFDAHEQLKRGIQTQPFPRNPGCDGIL